MTALDNTRLANTPIAVACRLAQEACAKEMVRLVVAVTQHFGGPPLTADDIAQVSAQSIDILREDERAFTTMRANEFEYHYAEPADLNEFASWAMEFWNERRVKLGV